MSASDGQDIRSRGTTSKESAGPASTANILPVNASGIASTSDAVEGCRAKSRLSGLRELGFDVLRRPRHERDRSGGSGRSGGPVIYFRVFESCYMADIIIEISRHCSYFSSLLANINV